MSAPDPRKEEVRGWLRAHHLEEYSEVLIDVMGCDDMATLRLLTDGDLHSAGMKPLHLRRAREALDALSTSVGPGTHLGGKEGYGTAGTGGAAGGADALPSYGEVVASVQPYAGYQAPPPRSLQPTVLSSVPQDGPRGDVPIRQHQSVTSEEDPENPDGPPLTVVQVGDRGNYCPFMMPFPFFCMGCAMSSYRKLVFNDTTKTITVTGYPGYCVCLNKERAVIPYSSLLSMQPVATSLRINEVRVYNTRMVVNTGSHIVLPTEDHRLTAWMLSKAQAGR